jgi:signal transduction histidine kinase
VRSLRGRLTLGITLVLAIVLAGAGIMVSRYVDRAERQALDDRLKSTAELSRETALAAVQQSLPSNDRRLDQVLSAGDTSLRLLLGSRVLLDSGTSPAGARPVPQDGLRTFEVGGRRYRSYVVSLERRELGGLARLEVTSGLRGLEQRQARLNRRLTAFGIAALIAAAAGVWFVSTLLLGPLRRLRAATARIASTSDLDQRVRADDGAAELRSLAESFNDMLARLGRSADDRERALAATRRFAADAGHELRTPLTSVLATLSALHRHPGMSPEQRAELVSDALAEHRRLVDLLDGQQALARGDATAVAHGDVDLADVVAATVDAACARHPEVSWSSELPNGPVVVRGWDTGLRMLVDNLVENAARHGKRPGGAVIVALREGPTLIVDDDGPGVAPGDRERIFEPFVRANGASSEEVPGSGLGLALVAQQVRDHGATVEVGESPLGGARFSVRF